MKGHSSAAGDRPRPPVDTQGSTNYDVIIVGGRVAGASTAMLLAGCGHRVLVVDRTPPTTDVVSTHAVLRTGVLQLKRWGVLDRIVEAGTPPLRTVTLGFGPERIPFEVRLEHGVDALYAPRRHVIDATIAEGAKSAGAEFAYGTRVIDVVRGSTGEVTGVVADTRHGTLVLTARLVIGADGTWSRIAELVGAPVYHRHPPTNAISYAYYGDIDTPGVWFQFTPGVNAGIIPTNEGLSCVFVGRPTKRLPAFRADPEAEFTRLLATAGGDLAAAVSAGRRATAFRGTPGLPGTVRKPWGAGWALVGDAGYTKDPISAHGISSALRDAELCARAVDRSLRSPESAQEAMTEYQAVRDRLSSVVFDQSRALARYRWDAVEASRRMRLISEAVRDECAAVDALTDWTALATA